MAGCPPIVAAILDEVAFWRADDSANPDREIVNALRSAMATVPGALLVGISSPYARRGVQWEGRLRSTARKRGGRDWIGRSDAPPVLRGRLEGGCGGYCPLSSPGTMRE